ncbi:MAG TPA: hypothetical protein VMV68_00790 [Spirochaetia bacterium]|nr:hypothetical protein [Spirochaetia bacterium]
MMKLRALNENSVAETAQRFVQTSTDLYVALLTEGRRLAAASLLQAIALAVAHLGRIRELPPGNVREEMLLQAARALQRISMLILYISQDGEEPSVRDELQAFDAAAELSGALKRAAAR